LGHGQPRDFITIRVESVACFLERVKELQFQVKGKDYFLAFVENEKRWYLFSATPQGVERIPVYVDAVKYGRGGRQGEEVAS
jgi:hypothetical protein